VSKTSREVIEGIKEALGPDWLPSIYRDKIRTQRTRSIKLDIAERINSAEIHYTLLGIELKVGKRRIACPDLATARYLRVFARIGSAEVAVPYDITRISVAADELETSWQRSMLAVDEEAGRRPAKGIAIIRTKLAAAIRDELNQIGPGDAMPAFDRETRQRGRET